MSKSPAFQFYASDFIHATAGMTAEEVGGYIRLLCYQWDRGSIPNDDERLSIISGVKSGIGLVTIRNKFGIVLVDTKNVPTGFLQNARLEEVRRIRSQFCEKQRKNIKRRWKKTRLDTTVLPNTIPEPIPNGYQTDTLQSSYISPKGDIYMSEKNEEKKKGKSRPSSAAEMESYAVSIGASAGQGDALFDKMEAQGWINGRNPVKDWQALVRTWHKRGYMPEVINATTAKNVPPPPPIPAMALPEIFEEPEYISERD